MPDNDAFRTLTPISLAILLALLEEERHGYALMKEVEARSEGRLRPGTGTLYAAVQRMMEEGLVAQSAREPGPAEDARRRYYGITAAGRSAAESEVARLARLVEWAEPRLAGDPGASR